uniref:Response regulatory domain-containing protein n=1 Tax=Salix viminalis TaxID=40686 RepID=A0A6N2LM72_SALVM
MQDPSSISGEDNTQIDQEIQNLFTRLDEHYAQLEKKKEVLENAIRSDIEALNKDQNEARKLRQGLLHRSGDITSSLESASQNIANVKQWLMNRNTLESDDDDDQDQSNNFSVLIVDDDRIVRETNRRFTGLAGTQKQLRMEFQEAKNGKEAVYLHLAGASFDLILMDFQMPIMNGIQATQLLRQMGVKSRIVGVTSESDQQAFFDAGLNNCIQKPLNPAKIAEFLIVSKKRKRIGTSQA